VYLRVCSRVYVYVSFVPACMSAADGHAVDCDRLLDASALVTA